MRLIPCSSFPSIVALLVFLFSLHYAWWSKKLKRSVLIISWYRQNSVWIVLLAVTYFVTPGLLTVDGTSSPGAAATPVAVDQWPTYMNTVQRLQVFLLVRVGIDNLILWVCERLPNVLSIRIVFHIPQKYQIQQSAYTDVGSNYNRRHWCLQEISSDPFSFLMTVETLRWADHPHKKFPRDVT